MRLIPLILSMALFSSVHAELITAAPIDAAGEKIIIDLPDDWRQAWTKPIHQTGYNIEYTTKTDDIESWKNGYLLVSRTPYPEGFSKTSQERISDKAAGLIQNISSKNCKGVFEAMSHRTNTFDGYRFSVTGGFCSNFGATAPYGEGSVFAFIEGEKFLHRVTFNWRPQSIEEQKRNWGLDADTIIDYLTRIKAVKLCGDSAQSPCPMPKQ